MLSMRQVVEKLLARPHNMLPVWGWLLIAALVLGGAVTALVIFIPKLLASQQLASDQPASDQPASDQTASYQPASALVLSLLNGNDGDVYGSVVPSQSVFTLTPFADLAEVELSTHIYNKLAALDVISLYKLSDNAVFVVYNTQLDSQPVKFALVAGTSDTTTMFTSTDSVLTSQDVSAYSGSWTSTYNTSTFIGYRVVATV
jgi:hypothetical protein